MIALFLSVALAGNDVKDIEIVRVVKPGGVVMGGWVAGRGYCPGERPSLRPAGDGRPCTYHELSPLAPWKDFEALLDSAEGQTASAWVAGCQVGSVCGWLAGLPVGEQVLAWEGARAR